jgi:GT2 family glycosyltransferase
MKLTLISTVLNEAANLGAFLDSLGRQNRLPDEVVFCDAGSRDGTVNILRDFALRFPRPFKVIEEPGNRSHGRNAAIREAEHDYIAGTDAGCVLDKYWLERLVLPFEHDPAVDVVSGFYQARGETCFERCAAVATLSTRGVTAENFLPSARSIAFRKEAWRRVGGFPEHLEFAEDTQFGLNLRKAGLRFVLAPDALVYWRPRSSPGQVFRQLSNYARGNVQAGILYANYLRPHLRYSLWGLLTAAVFIHPAWLALWIPAVLPYWGKWAVAGWRECRDWRALLLTPGIKLIADAGQFAGFWSGLCRPKRT